VWLFDVNYKWFAYAPIDATVPSFASLKSNGLPFWWQPTQVFQEKKLLNKCNVVMHTRVLNSVSISASMFSKYLSISELFHLSTVRTVLVYTSLIK